MMTLKIGDPITHVFANSVVHAHVKVTNEGTVYATVPGVILLRPEHENLFWFRGHHADDSDEVKAARVARELMR